MPLTILEYDELDRTDLDRYNVIISSGYSMSDDAAQNLKQWVENGGTLIAYRNALSWINSKSFAQIEFMEDKDDSENDKDEVKTRPYVKQGPDRGAEFIGGTIFNAKLDLTHPLGYGYNDDEITVFRNTTTFMKKGENPYSTPLYYTDDPLASGYISGENHEKIKGTAAIVVNRLGSGRVITMTDNPNFRAFWYGTNKLFANAIFFGHTISGRTAN
jgi:hypothetical protein